MHSSSTRVRFLMYLVRLSAQCLAALAAQFPSSPSAYVPPMLSMTVARTERDSARAASEDVAERCGTGRALFLKVVIWIVAGLVGRFNLLGRCNVVSLEVVPVGGRVL